MRVTGPGGGAAAQLALLRQAQAPTRHLDLGADATRGLRAPDGAGGAGGAGEAEATPPDRLAFANVLADAVTGAIDGVNARQADADATTEAFLRGDEVPMHRVMMQATEAETSVRLTTALTRKAIEAYQELSRIQI